MNEKLAETLQRFPVGLIFWLFVGYQGYQYAEFQYMDSSSKKELETQVQSAKDQTEALRKRKKEVEVFFQSVEQKKAEVRALSESLSGMRATLSESLDVPAFMSYVVSEAKRVGLSVVSFTPGIPTPRDYYVEQPFDMSFHGVFVQLLVFLDRLSQGQKLARIDEFDIHPRSGSSSGRYVDIEGSVKINAYYYLGTKEDDMAKNPSGSTAPSAAGGAGATAPQPGAAAPAVAPAPAPANPAEGGP